MSVCVWVCSLCGVWAVAGEVLTTEVCCGTMLKALSGAVKTEMLDSFSPYGFTPPVPNTIQDPQRKHRERGLKKTPQKYTAAWTELKRELT